MPHHFRQDPDPRIEEDEDLEPPSVYFDQQIGRVERSLEHYRPTDPNLVAKLERELDGWRRQKALAGLSEEWTGEGDRKLF